MASTWTSNLRPNRARLAERSSEERLEATAQPPCANSGSPRCAQAIEASRVCWGKKWGKKPHRLQPIPADLDLAKTARNRASRSPAEPPVRAHNPKVAGSNPAPAMDEFRDRPSGGRFASGLETKSFASSALSSKVRSGLS